MQPSSLTPSVRSVDADDDVLYIIPAYETIAIKSIMVIRSSMILFVLHSLSHFVTGSHSHFVIHLLNQSVKGVTFFLFCTTFTF